MKKISAGLRRHSLIAKSTVILSFLACLINGSMVTTSVQACPPPPPPPCDWPGTPVLTVTALDESRIELTWINVAYERGYRIYRRKDGQTSYTLIKTVTVNTLSYIDTSLACNTKYYYYVKAYNNCGTSSSNVKYATTHCCSATKASDPYPADKSVGISLEAILSWTPGDYAVAHHVYLDTDKDAVLNAVNPESYPGRGVVTDYCYYDPSGLKPGQTYYWRVDEIYPLATVCQEFVQGDVWECTVGTLVYVNEKAYGGLNDGSSWENAYLRLSDALLEAGPNSEIWVAQGTYTPSAGSFEVNEGVAIYGGFDGTETSRDDRDYTKYKTVLSGDLNRDDVTGSTDTRNDNAHTVVVGNHNVILDGLTVTGAYGGKDTGGGGIVLNTDGCAFSLRNCVVKENAGILGGGLNSIRRSASVQIINCEISANQAVAGAGICISNGSLTLQQSTIKNNSAKEMGGGILISGGQMCLENTLVAGNLALKGGGGIHVSGLDVNKNQSITNCTIVENKADEGGALCVSGDHNLLLENTIVWGNVSESGGAIFSDSGKQVATVYCGIQGGYNGSNIQNPSFVSAGSWDNSVWAEGDYHLQKTSPYIDAGTTVALVVDIEGNKRPFDYPRIGDNEDLSHFDLGAFETSFKSFSFTVAADIRPVAGSVNLQAWQNLLNRINTDSDLEKVRNESEFMVLLGDIDPPAITEDAITNALGSVYKYPVVGEHDFENAANMDWFYAVYDNQAESYVTSGPVNGQKTSYSWDYGFVHFVVLNEYYNGSGDTLTDGDVCDALYNWLAADLAANTKPFIIVMGHEPAYVEFGDKMGDSLDKYPSRRDRFWTLLESHKAKAYFCGHTHYYRNNNPHDSIVKQVITGSAGESGADERYRFLSVEITEEDVYTSCYSATVDGDGSFENDQPEARDVELQIEEGAYVTIDFADYMPGTKVRYVSDRNQAYDSLTLKTISVPKGEFSILQQDKTALKYKYTPTEGFTGEDLFLYQINDNSGTENANSQIAAIKVNVYPKNQSPLAGDGRGCYWDQPITIDLSSYTADRDGDILQYEVLQNPEYGNLDVSAFPMVTYTPDSDLLHRQQTSFVYRVCDSYDVSRNATFTLFPQISNLPPVAHAHPPVYIDEDSGPIEIVVSGSDPEGDTLSFWHYDLLTAQDDFGPYKARAHNLEDQGYKKEGTDNVFVYKPAKNKNGTDYFRFYASDGDTWSEPVEVVIHIAPINDPPVFGGPKCVSVYKNHDLEFSLQIDDPDDHQFYYGLNKTLPFHGDIKYTLPPGLLYSYEQDNAEDSYFDVIIGDRPSGDPDRLEIRPEPIQVQVLDDGEHAPTALPVRVHIQEDQIIAQAESFSTAENALILKAVDDGGIIQGYSYIIDSLPDPSLGTLYRDDQGVVAGETLAGPELAFKPADDVYGAVTFTYHAYIPGSGIRSDCAAVTIQISPVNDAPRVYEDKKCTMSGTQLRFRLFAEDVDGDRLQWFVAEADENEQTARLGKGTLTWEQNCFLYTPDAGTNGQDQFAYYVNDGQTNSDAETCFLYITDDCVRVKARSGFLTIDEDQAGGGLVSLELQEGNRDAPGMTFEILGEPNLHGTLIQGQTAYNYTYIPNQDYNGTVSFRFRACGTYSNSEAATFEIEIRAVNDAPRAGQINLYPDENSPVCFELPGHDVESDCIYFSKISEPSHGSAIQLFLESRQCIYAPQTDYFGPDAFNYRVFDRKSDEDPGSRSEGTVVVEVIQAGMGGPQAADQFVETDEDTPCEIVLTATDANHDALEYQIVSPAQDMGTYYRLSNGRLSKTKWSQKYIYEPDADVSGVDSFQFKAVELAPKAGESNVATVTIEIHPVNDAPRLEPQVYFTEQYTVSSILLAADDPEGDAITYEVLTQPAFGQLSGTTPNLSYYSELSGFDMMEIQLSDPIDTTVEPVYILVMGQQNRFERKYHSYDSLAAFGTAVAASEIDGQTFLAVASTSSGINEGRIDIYQVTPSHLEHYQTLPLPATVNPGYGISMKMEGGIVVVANHKGMPVSLDEMEDCTRVVVRVTSADGISFVPEYLGGDGMVGFEGELLIYRYNPGAQSWDYDAAIGPDLVSSNYYNNFSTNHEEGSSASYDVRLTIKNCFGQSFDFENNTLVVGSPGESKVYVYSSAGIGTWNRIKTLTPSHIPVFPCDEGTYCDDLSPYGLPTGHLSTIVYSENLLNIWQLYSQCLGYSVDIHNGRIVAGAPGWDVVKWVADPEGYVYDHLDVGLIVTREPSGAIRGDLFDPCSNYHIAQQFCRKPNLGVQVRLQDNNLQVYMDDEQSQYRTLDGTSWSDPVSPMSTFDIPLYRYGHWIDGRAVLRSDYDLYPHNNYGVDVYRRDIYPVCTTNYARAGSFFIVGAPTDSQQPGKTGAVYIFNLDYQPGRLVFTSGPSVANEQAADAMKKGYVTAKVNGDDSVRPVYSWSGTGPGQVTFAPNNSTEAGVVSIDFRTAGQYQLSVSAEWNGQTISKTIDFYVNNRPTVTAQSLETDEGVAATITLTGQDIEGDPLTFNYLQQPNYGTVERLNANTLLYTPDPEFWGEDEFYYYADDGTSRSLAAKITVEVICVPNSDHPAIAEDIASIQVDEDGQVTINLHATDADGDFITYSLSGNPAHGTVMIDGNIATYSANLNYNGSDSFVYAATDGVSSETTAIVTITVKPQNDTPYLVQHLEDQVRSDAYTGERIDLRNYFDDVDRQTNGDILTFSVIRNSNPNVVGAAVESADLILSHSAGQLGRTEIAVRATDLAFTYMEDTFYVEITEDPNPPSGDPALSVSTDWITASCFKNSSSVVSRTFSIKNSAGGILSWQVNHDCSWLDVLPVAGSSTGEEDFVTVTISPSMLQEGSNSAQLTIIDTADPSDSQIVTVAADLRNYIRVPEDHPNITDAIAAAENYDLIVVSPGSYYENLDFNGKNIVLTSSDPDDPKVVASTVIRGDGTRSVITYSGTEDQECKLVGFTVTGGHAIRDDAAGAAGNGGGILGNGTLAGIEKCIVRENKADGEGGGIHGVNGTIANCAVRQNTASNGGGLAQCYGTEGVLVNCLIAENTVMADGSAIYDSSKAVINATIACNRSLGQNAMPLTNCTGMIRNTIVSGNSPADLLTGDYLNCHVAGEPFKAKGYLHNNGTPQPSDDYWVEGDYSLVPESSCVNTGNNDYADLLLGALNSCIRVSDDIVDIGAYEYVKTGSIIVWENTDYNGPENLLKDAPKESCIVAISANMRVALALRKDGSIQAWGTEDYVANAPTGHCYKAIAAGRQFGLALTVDGRIAAWGENADGQCDVPDPDPCGLGVYYTAIAAGNTHALAIKSDGTIVTWGDSASRTNSPNLSGGAPFTAIEAGNNFSLGLRNNHLLEAWGNPSFGATDIPDGSDEEGQVSLISAFADFSFLHNPDPGDRPFVAIWGNKDWNPKKPDEPDYQHLHGVNATDIEVGTRNALVKDDHNVLTIYEYAGALGWNDLEFSNDTNLGNLGEILDIEAGFRYSLALIDLVTVPINVNDNDQDKDGIPDMADGFNFDQNQSNGDDENTDESDFVPCVVTLAPEVDASVATLAFAYEMADPMELDSALPHIYMPYAVDKGYFRIWTKDGNVARNANPVSEGGDFIEAYSSYSLDEDLGFSADVREITVYIEAAALRKSDYQTSLIEVRLDQDGGDYEHNDMPYQVIQAFSMEITGHRNIFESPAGNSPSAGRSIPVVGMDVYAQTYLHNGQLKVTHVNETVPGRKLDTTIAQTYRSNGWGGLSIGNGWFGNWEQCFFKCGERFIHFGPDGRVDEFAIAKDNPNYLEIPAGFACRVVIECQFYAEGLYLHRLKMQYGDGTDVYYEKWSTDEMLQDGDILPVTEVVTRYAPDKQNLYTKQQGYRILYNRDNDGSLESITDELGRRYVFTYSDGRLQSIDDVAASAQYLYSYEPLTGRLSAIQYANDESTSAAMYSYDESTGKLNAIGCRGDLDNYLDVSYSAEEFPKVSALTWGGRMFEGNTLEQVTETFGYREKDPFTVRYSNTNGVLSEYVFEKTTYREMLCSQCILDPDDQKIKSIHVYGTTEPYIMGKADAMGTLQRAEPAVTELPSVSDKRDYGLQKSFRFMAGRYTAPAGGSADNSISPRVMQTFYSGTDSAGSKPSENYCQLSKFIDAAGVECEYKYDSSSNLSEMWLPKQDAQSATVDPVTVNCRYNEYGQLVALLGSDGSLEIYDYTARQPGEYNGYLYRTTKTINGDYGEYFSSGDYDAIPDTDIVRWTYERDAHGRITAAINPKDGRTDYGYDSFGRIMIVTASKPSDELPEASRQFTIYRYCTDSARDRLNQIDHYNPVASGTPDSVAYAYVVSQTLYRFDTIERLIEVSQKVADTSTSTEVAKVSYELGKERVASVRNINEAFRFKKYDVLGRVEWEIHNHHTDSATFPTNIVNPAFAVRYVYNANNQVTDVFVTYGGDSAPITLQAGGDHEQHRTRFILDWAGRPAQTIDMVSGRLTKQAWDAAGRLKRVRVFDGEDNAISDITYHYHPNGDIQSIFDNIMNITTAAFLKDYEQNVSQTKDVLNRINESIYDSLGRSYILNQYLGTADSGNIRLHTEYQFNKLGNLERTASSTAYAYNNSQVSSNLESAPLAVYGADRFPLQLAVPELNALSRYWMSGNGTVGLFEDPAGILVRNEIDEFGDVTKTTEDAAVLARSTQIQRKRNVGQETVYRNGQATFSQYNLAGQHTATEFYYQASSVDTLGTRHAIESFSYDSMGRVETVTRKNGTILVYNYYAADDPNSNDRERLKSITQGTHTLREFADYNRFGQPQILKEFYTPGVTADYVLTTRTFYTNPAAAGSKYGYLQSETTQVKGSMAGLASTVTYRYDLLGRRTALGYPDGPDVQYVYEDGYLKQLLKDGTEELFLCDRTQDGFGLPAVKTYADAVAVSYEYKSKHLGLVSSLSVESETVTAFDYDARGLKEKTGQWQPDYFRDYHYDALGRLTSTTSLADDKFADEVFPLDQFENRTGRAVVDGNDITYLAHSIFKNRYASIEYASEPNLIALSALSGAALLLPADTGVFFDFGYDDCGNLTEDEQFVYTWDAFNRVTGIQDKAAAPGGLEEVVYLYDALGRRVLADYKKGAAGEIAVFVYDGYAVIERRDQYNVLQQRYYYEEGINRLALVETDAGDIYVPLLDDRGTLMGVADADGTIVEKLYYNSTGLCKSYSGSDVENVRSGTSLNIGRSQYIPFGWCGMYHDEYTGKYHTHYREYDPLHARWLSEDPAGYRDGLNLYANYGGVNKCDVLGLQIASGELLNAYKHLYGQNDPLLQVFLNNGGSINTGDVLGDLSVSRSNFTEGQPYSISVEEDLDLATASTLLRSGLLQVLGKDYSMGNDLLDLLDCDMLSGEWSEAAVFLRSQRFKSAASNAAALADLYVSSVGIFNEGLDIAQSAVEVCNGNYLAAAGFIPLVPSAAGKLLKSGDNVLDAAALRLVKKAGRSPYVDYVGKTKGWWRKYHYAIQNHHIFFKCLGGSDEAANMLSMRMMIHQGQNVGLQWNLVRHMNAKNYGELIQMYNKGDARAKEIFLDTLREGYSNYFRASPDYNEIMRLVDNSLENVKRSNLGQ